MFQSSRQPHGFCLTTAEILYFMPDHPTLLQSFVWQEIDSAPDFPALRRFLEFWRRELDGPLYRVRVMTGKPFTASPRAVGARSPYLH